MSISLNQLVDIILLETGQFISDLNATLLDMDKIKLMVQRELAAYSRYNPHKGTNIGALYNGKTFDKTIDGFVPDNIIDVRTYVNVNNGTILNPYMQMVGPVHNYYWQYTKPTLYFRYPESIYQYSYITAHEMDPVTGDLPTIELKDKFTNLIVGRFLQSVGKSRRAFTVDELPINTDADAMISEGKELYDSTMEEIRINSAFYFSILV